MYSYKNTFIYKFGLWCLRASNFPFKLELNFLIYIFNGKILWPTHAPWEKEEATDGPE